MIVSTRPFLSIEDQIKRLQSRGLSVSDIKSAKKVLSRENYYNVINGYKMPFLKKDLNGSLNLPEAYIKDCDFIEICSLHNLDRDLRLLLLGFLLKFETNFKTSCAYNFSDKFRMDYAYLNAENYSRVKNDLSNVLKNLAQLSAEINRNTNVRSPKSVYIGHYIEKHDSVPLWVLVSSLTIGNMSYFYNAIDEDLKEVIARDFSTQYKQEYGSKEKISSGEMKQVVRAVNLFRNVCAHEEVLYLFKLKKGIKSSLFSKYFNDERIDSATIEKNDLFALIAILKLVLVKDEYFELLDGVERVFSKHKENFKSVSFDDVVQLSGFSADWKEILVSAIN